VYINKLTSDTLLVDPETENQHNPQKQPPHSCRLPSSCGRRYGSGPGSHKTLLKKTSTRNAGDLAVKHLTGFHTEEGAPWDPPPRIPKD